MARMTYFREIFKSDLFKQMAYCQARRRLPLALFKRALQKLGQALQAKVGNHDLWHERRVWVVDGSSCSMPDTPDLQQAFGQPDGQRKGCGFPVARIVSMFCWATGAIADLYADRWTVELRLRDVKTTMGMDILRGKSPDVVCKEIYMHFLAYNLIRALMWQAAEEHDRPLHRLSFAGTMQHFHAVAPYLWLFAGTPKGRRLYQLLLSWIARDILPYRPNRVEPRAVKRRPKEYALLNRPRQEMRKALLRA